MAEIFEIRNGFLGASTAIEESMPAPAGWTFTEPPAVPDGEAAKWVGDGWTLVPAGEAEAAHEAAQAAERARLLGVALSKVDVERDRRIAQGKPHTFPDGLTGTVQLRNERDTGNVNAVATSGTALVIAGDAQARVAFRDAEDVTHPLSGEEAVAFGLAVMAWVSAHYSAAWAHKDAIRALAEAGDLEGLEAYDLTQGWAEDAP